MAVRDENGEADIIQAATAEEHPPELPRMEEEEVKALEEILGYNFVDKELLVEALTHGSYYCPLRSGVTYKRLEYIGDAVLNLLVARSVFFSYRDLLPVPLTKLRASNVDTERLARLAVNAGLHPFIRHKAPKLHGQIEEFMKGMLEYPIHSNGMLETPKVLADIVESLMGAIFVDTDSSNDAVWKVFCKLAEPLISLETLGKHPMSELHEFCQKNKLQLRFINENDRSSESTTVEVLVNDTSIAHATCFSKKEIAQNRAAKAALDKLKELLGDMLESKCSI